jgi:chromosome segregation ATPase
MNARLSLNNRPEPSLAEQAHRLESFEIALREERIKELEAKVAQYDTWNMAADQEIVELTDQIAQQKEQLAMMANEQKLSLERNAEGLKREQELRDRVCKLLRENHQLKDTRDEFEKAGNQLADDKEKLQTEVERLVVQDNANARVLTKTQQQLKEAQAEVKRLKALDPDRLSKQVKRLQKEKAEALAGAKEMRAKNHQLAKQNRQLDAALDKAVADVNAGMEIKPERVFEPGRVGRWELFTCPKDGWYQLLDTENEVSQTVRVEGGELITPKIRPVPKVIAAEVLAFHQEFFGGAV